MLWSVPIWIIAICSTWDWLWKLFGSHIRGPNVCHCNIVCCDCIGCQWVSESDSRCYLSPLKPPVHLGLVICSSLWDSDGLNLACFSKDNRTLFSPQAGLVSPFWEIIFDCLKQCVFIILYYPLFLQLFLLVFFFNGIHSLMLHVEWMPI